MSCVDCAGVFSTFRFMSPVPTHQTDHSTLSAVTDAQVVQKVGAPIEQDVETASEQDVKIEIQVDALQRGNTDQAVDCVMQQRRKTLIAGVVQALLGVVVVVLDVVGVTSKADDDNCDSSPLEWGLFYFVHAIACAVGILANLLMLYAASLTLNNRNLIRMQIHKTKGALTEAQQDAKAGMAEAARGTKIMMSACCCLCPVIIFVIVWFIMGIVTFVNSDGSACEDAKTWFWMIVLSNMVMQSIGSLMKPDKKQKS
eukprot:TRINITY_DN45301_c0_g1_i1.p1 TRINITY_DN45301_c0_g1~~TRINITY_DN45301_c0_g1_i1.p1  ORF type:complete len:256 (-),score=43.36 TRINITY_DN45301_c0_g1_i1:171-938(-)